MALVTKVSLKRKGVGFRVSLQKSQKRKPVHPNTIDVRLEHKPRRQDDEHHSSDKPQKSPPA